MLLECLPPDKIVYCYGEYQQLFLKYTHVEFNRGLPSLDDFDGKQTVLFVLDDLMNEADQTVANLFTRGSHHRNVSLVLLAQNLFSKNKFARTIDDKNINLQIKNIKNMFFFTFIKKTFKKHGYKTLNCSILSSKKHRQYASNKVNSTATKHSLCPGNGVCLTLTRQKATQFCMFMF